MSPSSAAGPLVALQQQLKGKMILAPLTRGGNLPYRRLCADFGCEASLGEMVYARHLLKGDRLEQARLRRASNERLFGVQIATNDVDEGVRAAALAASSGADFVDLNCGCPIYEATRRGLGAALLRRPERLQALVAGVAAASAVPLTVKVRIGTESGNINVREVVAGLRDAGAAAVTVHGRTMEQRYSRAANWEVIRQVVQDGVGVGSSVPIVGNGDLLTHYEARRRMDQSGVDAVMVGRGALVKPWIFQEFADGRDWDPSAAERVALYRRLVCYMKEHFGDDARGRRKSWYFLPWHFDFLCRYTHYPEADFAAQSEEQSLLQTRLSVATDLPPLERLLVMRGTDVHERVAAALWDSDSDEAAVQILTQLAASPEIAQIATDAASSDAASAEGTAAGDAEELANVPSSSDGPKKRKGRTRTREAPKRTEEEIAQIRAERAAKRALTGAPPHVDGGRRK